MSTNHTLTKQGHLHLDLEGRSGFSSLLGVYRRARGSFSSGLNLVTLGFFFDFTCSPGHVIYGKWLHLSVRGLAGLS